MLALPEHAVDLGHVIEFIDAPCTCCKKVQPEGTLEFASYDLCIEYKFIHQLLEAWWTKNQPGCCHAIRSGLGAHL